MIETIEFGKNYHWIILHTDFLTNDTADYQTLGLDEETITYALDRYERAHTEYQTDTNTFTIIYNVLKRTKEENHYETIPITFIAKKQQLFTIYNDDNAYIIDLMKKYLAYNNQISVVKFLFVGLFLISESYFPYIEALDKKQEEVSRKLRKKITKPDLLTLSDIATGMIYLVAATNQNIILLEQIKGQIIYKQFDEIEREQYVDSLIEAKQLSSMTQLNSEIIQQLYSTYDNILNNNLNDHMAVLTVLSIFLAISATVTGFFGMNVTLPIKDSPYAWLVIIGISLILCLIYALVLRITLLKK